MYIECKSGGLEGLARIGRVTYSKTGRSLTYNGDTFIPIQGFKSNFLNVTTDEQYWISGAKKRGGDRLYGTGSIEIDDDIRAEYWCEIRQRPDLIEQRSYRE
jgi:hypothetical protein